MSGVSDFVRKFYTVCLFLQGGLFCTGLTIQLRSGWSSHWAASGLEVVAYCANKCSLWSKQCRVDILQLTPVYTFHIYFNNDELMNIPGCRKDTSNLWAEKTKNCYSRLKKRWCCQLLNGAHDQLLGGSMPKPNIWRNCPHKYYC